MSHSTIKDRAYAVLTAGDGPMNYRAIAATLRGQGVSSAPRVKNPDKQFHRTVWVALTRDDRVQRIGPGLFTTKEPETQR